MASPVQFRMNAASLRMQKVATEGYATAYGGGYTGTDDTACLQAAIDEGLERIIVDVQAGPWVLGVIDLASNQRIIFKPGVTITAKAGAFDTNGASMFRVGAKSNVDIIGYGVTVTMNLDEYLAFETPRDNIHCFSITGSTGIGVYGFSITGACGDAIYIGTNEGECKNIHIDGVTSTDNYRNGISVVNVDGLVINNTTCSKTTGADMGSPGAAIDFEPNFATEKLANITVNNLLSTGNCYDVLGGTGGILINPVSFTADSEPISIAFNRCTSEFDRISMSLITADEYDPPLVPGSVVFNDCVFKGGLEADDQANANGLIIKKSNEAFQVDFNRCTFEDLVLEAATESPIVFYSPDIASADPVHAAGSLTSGGLSFVDCEFIDSVERAPFKFGGTLDSQATDITGNIILNDVAYDLTTANLQAWMPQYDPIPGARFFTRSNSEYFVLGTKLNPAQENFWVSFWCRQVARVSGEYYTAICTGATGNPVTGFLVRMDDSGHVDVRFNSAGTVVPCTPTDIDPVALTWTHYLVTFSRGVGGTITIYKNGIASATTADISGQAGDCTPYSTVGSTIGAYVANGTPTLWQNGAIACLAWGHKATDALPSEAERAELYNAGASAKYAVLSAGLKDKITSMWNLDEASGNALDATATANHGTDTNTVTYVAGPASYV